MAVFRQSLVVHYEDGEPMPVEIDQRECAMFERDEKLGTFEAFASRPMLFLRAVAYYGLRRRKLLPLEGGKPISREAWEDRVVEVEAADDPEDDADPGLPAASAGASSGSR